MNSKSFSIAALIAGVLAGTAAMAQPPTPAATEPDFAAAAAQRLSPPRAGAERALQQLAAHWQSQAGTLPQGFPFDVGDVADLAQAQLGYGFQVFDADPQKLLGGDTLAHSANATGVWRFAVVLNDRPIGLLTVARGAQGWDVVSIGGAGLSKDIAAVVQTHGGNPNAALRYVRVPQATADFIEVDAGSSTSRFVPLQAARESLRLNDAKLLEERELQPLLRDAVSRNLAN